MQLGGLTNCSYPFIWSPVSDLMLFRNGSDNCIKCCANLWKSVAETMAMITQTFEEENSSHTRKVLTQRDRKHEAVEKQSQENCL
jgi:hypothetical protein